MDKITWEIPHRVIPTVPPDDREVLNANSSEINSLTLTDKEKKTIKHIDDLLIALSVCYKREEEA